MSSYVLPSHYVTPTLAVARYRLELFRYSFFRRKNLIRAILFTDGKCPHNDSQFDAFRRFRRELREYLGFVSITLTITPEWAPSARFLKSFDMICLKRHYKVAKDDVLKQAQEIVLNKRPNSAFAYFDGNDEISIQWPGLLRYCDVYWKKQLPVNSVDAIRAYEGGTNLTHEASGRKASDAEPSLDSVGVLPKILLSPSMALSDKLALQKELLEDERVLVRSRPIDVVLRADIPRNWMGAHRQLAVEALQSIGDKFDIILPDRTVGPAQYAAEMGQSKICLSPFGYGEICYRDYEAALHGCLLFKPDMSHVRSEPDIFRPFETYVPLRRDYRDLGEKVSRYASDGAERARIVSNARHVLRSALKPEWFVARVKKLLEAAGLR